METLEGAGEPPPGALPPPSPLLPAPSVPERLWANALPSLSPASPLSNKGGSYLAKMYQRQAGHMGTGRPPLPPRDPKRAGLGQCSHPTLPGGSWVSINLCFSCRLSPCPSSSTPTLAPATGRICKRSVASRVGQLWLGLFPLSRISCVTWASHSTPLSLSLFIWRVGLIMCPPHRIILPINP